MTTHALIFTPLLFASLLFERVDRSPQTPRGFAQRRRELGELVAPPRDWRGDEVTFGPEERVCRNADIVHLHVQQFDAAPLSILSKLQNKPVVLTYHW